MKEQNSFIFNFRKFGVLLLAIAVVFVVATIVTNELLEKFVINKSEISGAAKLNRIINETHKEEIPIFGSSRANSSFVPSIINENCYNYGIDGTNSNVWMLFLKEELKKEKKGPIIINFDLDGLKNSIGAIDNYIPNSDNENVKKLVADYDVNLPSSIFKYFGTFTTYIKYYLNERVSITKEIDKGGAFNVSNLSDSRFKQLVDQRLTTKTKFWVQGENFSDLMAILNTTDRTLVFAIPPYHKSYFKEFVNYDVAMDYLSEINDRENCLVLDYSKYTLENPLFSNTTHLNFLGAKAFSELLKEDLLKKGLIP